MPIFARKKPEVRYEPHKALVEETPEVTLRKFQQIVHDMAKRTPGRPQPSDGRAQDPDFAAIVIRELFGTAGKSVTIFNHDLNEIYGRPEVARQAVFFLTMAPEAKIDIVTSVPPTLEHPFLKALQKAKLLDRVDMHTIPYNKFDRHRFAIEYTLADGLHHHFLHNGDPGLAGQFKFHQKDLSIVMLEWSLSSARKYMQPVKLDTAAPV